MVYIAEHEQQDKVASRPFADVRTTPKQAAWSTKPAPAYLNCTLGGMCLRGECTLPKCEAFGRTVICNPFPACTSYVWRLGDSHVRIACPCCNTAIVPLNVGFNNCFYRITGKPANYGAQQFNGKWQEAGNCFVTWTDIPRNPQSLMQQQHWEMLEFSVRANPNL